MSFFASTRAARRASLVAVAIALGVSTMGAEVSAGQPGPRAARDQTVRPASAATEADAAVGTWTVNELAPGRYQVVWSSDRAINVTDARPHIVGAGVGATTPTVFLDRRTVSVEFDSAVAPDPSAYDVELGSRVLDEASVQPQGGAVPYTAPHDLDAPADDPGVPGSLDVERVNFAVPPQKIAGMPLRSEMREHVVQPTDADNTMPLVLFLHGRHSPCYRPDDGKGAVSAKAPDDGNWRCPGPNRPIPSYLGYDYAQELLASQGYVTTSISANAINDQDWRLPDGGAAARASLIRRHLDVWNDRVGDGTLHADLTNVILVGHSRGGEGANRASMTIPLSAPYEITGQVLIGPTNFGFQTAPYVPTVTVLPYCDGDVSDLQGQIFTDNARDVVTDDTALHSSIMVMGANHNFFNSEWTPGISVAPSNDDWFGNKNKTCGTNHPARLDGAEQRLVGKTYIAGAVHLFASDDQDVLSMYDGSAVAVPSADNADVRSHAIGAGRELRRPALDTSLSTTTGAATRFCVGRAGSGGPSACARDVNSGQAPHWVTGYPTAPIHRRVFEMVWDQAGEEGGLSFDDPLDLSGADSLDLRTIVEPGSGPAELTVRLHDADGDVVVSPENGTLLPFPGGGYSLSKRWAHDLRVPLAGVTDVDLSAITGVDLVAQDDAGKVWVLDLAEVSGGGLPAVPHTRVPTISLGNLSQPEGDGPNPSTALLPYTVSGTLAVDAEIVVAVEGQPPYSLTVPAATTSGTIPIEYEADTTDDQQQLAVVYVYGKSEIQTDRYVGRVKIIDDDPSPDVTLEPESRRITEGELAKWTMTLSGPVDYYAFAEAKAVAGGVPGPKLKVGDLTPRFRERHFFPIPDLDTPLAQTDLFLYAEIEVGRLKTAVRMPTLRDNRDEGTRSITLRFKSDLLPSVENVTVFVRDPS